MSAVPPRAAPPGPAGGRGARLDASLADTDPEVAALVARELERQRRVIELIASENLASRAVLEAQGSVLTNKTVEGYPGNRYHGGAGVVDELERLAVERACRLFGCAHANVQPHSGSQANQAVLAALLAPGDTVLSQALHAGGHLSHGARVHQSGRIYRVVHYEVAPETGRVDYDQVAALAAEHRPKLVIAGGSAYPRALDFARLGEIAGSAGAWLLVDMAHFAGLVAGGAHPSPFPHAHVATTTTYKSLRGARGGIILVHEPSLARRIDAAVFPGVQGSPLLHAMAAKAVTLGEALQPAFREHAAGVLANARALAAGLAARGLDLVGGGTDTPLMLVDLRARALTGRDASRALERASITCNKNAVPFDPEKPAVTSGLRFGVSACTTRGFGSVEFAEVATLVADVLDALGRGRAAADGDIDAVRERAEALAGRFPLYAALRG